MSRGGRIGVFAVGGVLLLGVLVVGLNGLPALGDMHTIYSQLVQRVEPSTRKATDLVTALNFDLRAFDTLGEEFILFASVSGVALLLRHVRGDELPGAGQRLSTTGSLPPATRCICCRSYWCRCWSHSACTRSSTGH